MIRLLAEKVIEKGVGLKMVTPTLTRVVLPLAGGLGTLTGGFLGSHYQDVFAFFVLIGVLVFRPSGLLGERVAERA